MAKVLTNKIQSLLTYANGVTSKEDATLGDAVKSLADGYGQGGDDTLKAMIDGSITEITTPSGLTTIGSYAFEKKLKLASVEVSSGITSIGDYAFSGCSKLGTIILPSTLKTINAGAFYQCSALTNITIPDSVVTIQTNNTFAYCSVLEKIIIPDSVVSSNFGGYIFNACRALKSAVLGINISGVGSNLFSNCTALEEVTLRGSTLKTFSNNPFYNCTALAHIYVDSSLVDAYKAASGWSTYADIISAIEE